MGFRSLQHLRNRRSTQRGLCLPATFRLQGLATLLTVFSLRSRAGFVSTRQRSWDSPFGAFSSRKVRGRCRPSAPTYRFANGSTTRPKPRGRPRRPRFLGFDPSGSPWRPDTCLACRALDAPLGFPFEGTPATALTGISPDLLSRASPGGAAVRGGRSRRRSAPQSIDQPSLGPTRISDRKQPERLERPLEGFHTRLVPNIRTCRSPGYEFTGRAVVRCRRPPHVLRTSRHILPELPGLLEVSSVRDLHVAQSMYNRNRVRANRIRWFS